MNDARAVRIEGQLLRALAIAARMRREVASAEEMRDLEQQLERMPSSMRLIYEQVRRESTAMGLARPENTWIGARVRMLVRERQRPG